MSEIYVPQSAANQPPPLAPYNLFATDLALRAAVQREGADWAVADLLNLGARCGSAEVMTLGEQANRYAPVLHTHDRYGNRRDAVEFHPAYHALMQLGCAAGLHSSPWAQPRAGAHVARAAAYVLYGQVDNGTQCPLTMTYAATPVLEKHAATLPALKRDWLPRIFARSYDARFVPIEPKTAATIGMGMTERQGGSDVRANTTQATPLGAREPGQPYRIVGHKWFFSAPMCDAFLILAQAEAGISCFFLPRFLPNGSINAIRLQRLKDKLGNRSNASSEAEFHDATAWLLGDEGRGVPTILEMVNYTRLDCSIGATGVMRQALVQAIHYARHRKTFGKRLAEHALMQNVLADLALEAKAAMTLTLRLARAYDRHDDANDEAHNEVQLRRVMTPAAKFFLCKRQAAFCQEAMEVLGGSGHVEESNVPRLYREAPLNSIWEGSGNIMCLDVLRAAKQNDAPLDAVFSLIDETRGADTRLDHYTDHLRRELSAHNEHEFAARRLVEGLVIALQAALLLQHAPPFIAEAFCASRLNGSSGRVFGCLPANVDCERIIERAFSTAKNV